MNLLYIFLSIFFSTVSPSFTNNEGHSKTDGTTTTQTGGTKVDKNSNGDFIVGTDLMP